MTVIDHPEQVERLMERLSTALPIPARLTPEVQMTLQQQRGVTMTTDCSVTWISYAGDEGGIVCRLEAPAETAEAVFASITHLRFDPRLPFIREIVAYQKHRVKRLRIQRQEIGVAAEPTIKRVSPATLTTGTSTTGALTRRLASSRIW